MAVVFGLIEIAAGLMPSYLTYAAILPVLGLAALLTLTALLAGSVLTRRPTPELPPAPSPAAKVS
jgi:hypothetical protein